MIKVYYLPIEYNPTTNTEAVLGSEYIHNAILDATEDSHIRKLIMDTTPDEHNTLTSLALEIREPNAFELEAFNAIEPTPPPTQDELRAAEILATSPNAITMPEIWELLRILGRRLGYKLE